MRPWSTLRTFALMAAFALLTTACTDDPVTTTTGGDSRSPEGSGTSEFDGAWTLTGAMIDGQAILAITDWPVTLVIECTRVRGRASCNSYSGSATVDGSLYSVGSVSQTEMGCEQEPMEQEARFLSAFTQIDGANRTGNRLALTGDYAINGITVQFTMFGAGGECSEALRSQDSRVISVLQSGFTTEIDGGRLTISTRGGEGLGYTTR
jgi:heat shock protein HslJ